MVVKRKSGTVKKVGGKSKTVKVVKSVKKGGAKTKTVKKVGGVMRTNKMRGSGIFDIIKSIFGGRRVVTSQYITQVPSVGMGRMMTGMGRPAIVGSGFLDNILSIGKKLLPVIKDTVVPMLKESKIISKTLKNDKEEGGIRNTLSGVASSLGFGRKRVVGRQTRQAGGFLPLLLSLIPGLFGKGRGMGGRMPGQITPNTHLVPRISPIVPMGVNNKMAVVGKGKRQKGGFWGMLAKIALPLLGNLLGGPAKQEGQGRRRLMMPIGVPMRKY